MTRLRTALLAETLVRRGHSVRWWASAFNHFRKQWEFQQDTSARTDTGIEIRALRGVGYGRNLSPRRWLDYRLVAAKFRREAAHAPRPDVIVASMPGYDMADAAVSYGKAHGVPVLVDVRDQWPESFVDPLPTPLRPMGRLLLSGETRIMRRCLAGADGLVSMSESLLAWGLAQAGRPRADHDRVFYLSAHAPSESCKPATEALAAALARVRGAFIVAFVGTFGHFHNPATLIQAARRLKGEGFHFVLAGDGPLWAATAQAADGLDNVDLPGWLGQSDIDILLSRAAVGACPTGREMLRPFLPNKVSAYLAAGLPIVSAFPGELRTMIEHYGVGSHFSTVDELVAVLRRLKIDTSKRASMLASALALFARHFDATRTYEAYADHVEQMMR